jgi:mycofactocin glycosyltransferase
MIDRPRPYPLPAPPAIRTVPEGFRARMSLGVRLWAGGRVLVGGSPWKVSTLAPAVQDLVLRLHAAGAVGISVHTPRDRAALRVLLDRGFAERAPGPAEPARVADVDIVIPVLNDPERLRGLLATLPAGRVLVVDDGSTDPSSTENVAQTAGARIVRHQYNRGPAAARNTGLQHTSAEFVAFIDADCLAHPSWPAELLRHFEDPAVAAVAPRIQPAGRGESLLERYETTRSSLDMGGQPELVRPGARLGFVPSAALVVRRSAIQPGGFDEDLRLGEDVDLIWRLAEAGWLVRYDPSVTVRHSTRSRMRSWLRRKMEYGTSAADLEARHPGGLTPARPSAWNVGILVIASTGHPLPAAVVLAVAGGLLRRRIRSVPDAGALASRTVGQGLIADAVAIGHLLRREWWPVGSMVLAASPFTRPARVAAACMLVPIAWDWATQRPPLDPVRYTVLRLVDDAAYGSGVIASCIRNSTARPLMPRVRGTSLRRTPRTPAWWAEARRCDVR